MLLVLLRRYRPALARLLLIVGIGFPLCLAIFAIVARAGDWPAQRFLLIYIAPMFAFAAIWGRQKLAELDHATPRAVAIDAAAFVAGGIRVGGWGILPYSGHMLFLTFVAVTSRDRRVQLAALGLLAMTTWFKLALWHDRQTWTLGLAAGLALGLAQRLWASRVVSAPAR